MKNLFTTEQLRQKYNPDFILKDIEKFYSENQEKLIKVLSSSDCPLSHYKSDSQISFFELSNDDNEIVQKAASLLKDTMYFMMLTKSERTNVTRTMRGYYTELIKNHLIRVNIILEDSEIASPKHTPDPYIQHKGMSQVYGILKIVQKTLLLENECRNKQTRSGYLTGLQVSMAGFFAYLQRIGMTQKHQLTLVQHLFDGFKVDWEEGDRDNIKHSLQIPALSYYKSHQEDLQKLSSSIHSSKINQSLLANLVDHAILLKKRIGRF